MMCRVKVSGYSKCPVFGCWRPEDILYIYIYIHILFWRKNPGPVAVPSGEQVAVGPGFLEKLKPFVLLSCTTRMLLVIIQVLLPSSVE